MATEGQVLGAYCGVKNIYFCLSDEGGKPLKMFFVPLKDEHHGISQEKIKNSVDGSELGACIQVAFESNKISTKTIHLSLPVKDIIFRTFVIPWVQATEVKTLVEFEAAKYIPFSLNELSFGYHTTVFTEKDLRRIRVIFVAIKKSTLEKYTVRFEALGFNPDVIEPAALSLIRVLLLKKLLNPDQTAAVICKRDSDGKIMIVDKGLPLFVREFRLAAFMSEEKQNALDNAVNRLANEIRISCDYFNRQEMNLTVNEGMVIAGQESDDYANILKGELDFPIVSVPNNKIDIEDNEWEAIYAYGASIVDSAASAADLLLTEWKFKKGRRPRAGEPKNLNPTWAALTAAFCALMIGGLVWTYYRASEPLNSQISALRKELGAQADTSASKIEMASLQKTKLFTELSKVRYHSEIVQYLSALPKLLPDGTWLKNLEIAYPDSKAEQKFDNNKSKIKNKKAESGPADKKKSAADMKKEKEESEHYPNVIIEGYGYRENVSEQFGLVNEFFAKLSNNALFKDHFSKITLESVTSDKMNDFSVTYFKIQCQE
jgi:hypothetical protein